MYKLCLIVAVVLTVAGCAATSIEPETSTALAPPTSETLLAPDAPVTEVEMTEFTERTSMRCENVTRTGSRIVIGKRCWPRGGEVADEEQLARQIDQVRRDQDILDRMAREREEQQRRRAGGL